MSARKCLLNILYCKNLYRESLTNATAHFSQAAYAGSGWYFNLEDHWWLQWNSGPIDWALVPSGKAAPRLVFFSPAPWQLRIVFVKLLPVCWRAQEEGCSYWLLIVEFSRTGSECLNSCLKKELLSLCHHVDTPKHSERVVFTCSKCTCAYTLLHSLAACSVIWLL